MAFNIKRIGIIGFLAVILIIAFSFKPLSTHKFQITQPGYYHFWHFSGQTPTEWKEGPARTVDSVAFPLHFSHDLVIQQASEELVKQLTSKMQEKFAENGVQATIIEVIPHIEIRERQESRQYRDYTEATMYYTVVAGADVEFKTDQPISEGEYKPGAIFVIGILVIIGISAVIGSFYVYPAIAEWIRGFAINESVVETEYYDDEGNLVKTEKTWQRGFDWQGFVWIAIVVGIILIIGAIVVLPILFGFGRR